MTKEKLEREMHIISIAGVLAIFLIMTLFTFFVQAESINMDKIAQIESNNNPDAVSFKGAIYGRGKYQVSEAALSDYNRFNSPSIAPEELFDPEVCHRVAKWYFGQIRRYLDYYNIPEGPITIIASYNWGIGNVVKWYRAGADTSKLPAETREYIRKYREEK